MIFGNKAKQMENESSKGKLINLGSSKLDQVKWHSRERDDYASSANRMNTGSYVNKCGSKVIKAVVLKIYIFSVLPSSFLVETLI